MKNYILICQTLTRNYRHILLAIILMLIFFFGRNFELSDYEKIIKNASKKNNQDYRININSDESEKAVPLLNSAPGDYYRLFFDIKSQANETDFLSYEELTKETKLNLYLKSNLGRMILIKDITVPLTNQFVPIEATFSTDSNYQDLIFAKINQADQSAIEIKNLRLERLLCRDAECFNNLAPTINGRSRLTLDQEMIQDREPIFKLNRRKQTYGQVFQSQSDNIAEVVLAIDKVGTGGAGCYQIKLQKAAKDGDGFRIDPIILASFYFEVVDLEDYMIFDNVYRFPLASELTKEEYYYLSLSNEENKFNLFNTLVLAGDSDADSYQNGGALLLGQQGTNGNLYFQTYTAPYQNWKGKRILGNATIEDLGQGVGRYTYQFSNSAYDYLDIWQKNLIDPKKNRIYFDNITRSISASDADGVDLIYRFEIIYPIKQASINVRQIEGEFSSVLIYYSLDQLHWIPLKPKNEADLKNEFEAVFSPEPQSSQIYLKVTRNEKANNHKVNLFGIDRLGIKADLIMK